jgi:Holliday junction resolvasome RuvABC endonuclease subunit
MILGVDISTSITGFAIVAEGEIVFYDSVDLRKYKNVFQKAERIKEAIFEIFDNYQFDREDDHWMTVESDANQRINHIYIEQSLHMFMGGKSSAKTLSALTRFNGIVSWLIYEMFSMEPKYIGASSARKQAGIKVPRGQKAKQVVLQHLLDNEPAFTIEYTQHGNPKPESYDRADAIVIAKAGWAIEQTSSEEDTE